MLKGISHLLSPELLKVLCEMGHGDRIVLGDGNFPAESVGKNSKVIRCDGIKIPELLDAILRLFPLDTYVECPVGIMQVVPGDDPDVPIWKEYYRIVENHDPRGRCAFSAIERFAFYEEAKACYAVVSTGETAIYANIILQKGVVINK